MKTESMKTIITALLLSICANSYSRITKQWLLSTDTVVRDTVPCVIVYFQGDSGVVMAAKGYVVYGLSKSLNYPLYVIDILMGNCKNFPENVTIISYHHFYVNYDLKILSNKHWGVLE